MYELISVDDHVIEPPGVWSDRLPAGHREAGPHVVEADGREFWEYEGRQGETMGLNAVAGKPQEQWDMDPVRYSDMIPGCYDPKARAEDLSLDNIIGSVCFPTLPRFGGALFLEFDDKELADLCVKAYNDFMIEEWCAAVPGLYIPMVICQLWDPEAAAAEVRRCADLGARALSLVENPVPLGLPSFYTDHWDPLWRALEETDTVVCMHIGTSGKMEHPSPEASFSVSIMLAQVNANVAMVNLLTSPVLRTFPDLQVVLSEGGIGWIPSSLERIDRMWERHRMWAGLDDLRPSELFRRNFYGCFVDDRVGIENRHHIGVDRIMWECDFPHVEAPWPHSQETVGKALAGVPDEEVAMITHGNARRLFRWPGGGGAGRQQGGRR